MITKLDIAAAAIEPLPDPPEKTDMRQDIHYVPARSTLGAYFGKFDDVLVAGYGYLIVSRGSVEDWGQHFYPDCVVAFGVDPEAIIARNGYVISEVGKPPEFVLEIASRTTARRDGQAGRLRRAGSLRVLEIRRLPDGSLLPAAVGRPSGG